MQSPLIAGGLADPDVQRWPNAYYQALRRTDPVHFDEQLGAWLVSRYDDVSTVLRDAVTYSEERGYYSHMARSWLDELKEVLVRDGGGWFPDVVNVDPPRHARARKLVQQAFTAHRIAALEGVFAEQVDRLIDTIVPMGRFDGLSDLALPMAIGFAIGQLGITDLEQSKIRAWGTAYLAQFGHIADRNAMLEIAAKLCELQHYLIAYVRDRVENPREDMISDLVGARIDDPQPALEFGELVATARAFLINTHDTTSSALVNVLFAVATDPLVAEEFYASAHDNTRMGRLIEEVLRLQPPVRAMSRVTTRPVSLAGNDIPEGAQLMVLFGAANDDETAFANPRAFEPARSGLFRTMTFGAGEHLCLGIALARMQLRVAACKVAQRLHDLSLTVPAGEIRILPNFTVRSLESLPLRFTTTDCRENSR